jgi:hypothetical protein
MTTRRVTRRGGAAAITAMVLYAGALSAQTTTGPCTVSPAPLSGADACRKASDLFSFIMPQAGVALAAGNPVPGEGGTMGGWGKRAVALRVTAVDGRVPRNVVPISVSGQAVASDFGAQRAPVPVPSVDAAIGVISGFPAGLTNVLGVDALLGATYLPTLEQDEFRLAPASSSFAFSYGVRIGALQESSLIPGVSLSYMRRKLPVTNLRYASANDTIAIRDLSSTANSLRLVVSKRVALVGLALGVGRDEIEGTASMGAVVNETVSSVPVRASVALPDMRSKVQRNTAFVNASFGISILRVVGEFGWSAEGDSTPTLNTFGGRRANEAYRYGSLGLLVRF